MISSLFRDSYVYGLSLVLSRAVTLLSLPFYTRAMSQNDYGALELLLTGAALANLVVALEISQGLARYWSEMEGEVLQRKLASTAFSFTVLSYLAFLVLSLAFSQKLSLFLFDDTTYLSTFRLGVCFIFFNGVFNILHNLFRWQLRSKLYSALAIVNAFLTFFSAVTFSFGLGLGVDGVLLGYVLANIFSLVIAAYLLRENLLWLIDRKMLRKLLLFSLPLVPSGIGAFLMMFTSRIALATYASLEDVAAFGVAIRIAGIVTVLLMGVRLALTPLIYKYHEETTTPQNIADLFRWVVAIALLVCLGIGLFAQELIWLLSTPAYADAAGLVTLLVPAVLLMQMYVFLPGIAIKKRTGLQFLLTIISAVINVLLHWLIVPIYGTVGAAIVTLFSASMFFVSWILVSQKLYFIPFLWKRIVSLCLVFICLLYLPDYLLDMAWSRVLDLLIKASIIGVFAALILWFKVVTPDELHACRENLLHWKRDRSR